ncbi:MAG: glycosyltransferase family 39 protein [Clostridia bacterium]|nr:glycosyltransferase family 39 protein [Clostridia bacterium]
MFKKNYSNCILAILVGLSLVIKLVLIARYKNLLTLGSDDINYIKSAIVLAERGTFTFHNYNEPTVFIMPLYPMFLASVFKIFGYGLASLQIVRVIQAVLSCITIILVYLTAKFYFNKVTGLIAALLMAFYIPNIITVGYMLTETVFTMLLCLLIYLSLRFLSEPGYMKVTILGLIWTAATLCRPTVALYPILFFFYLLVNFKMKVTQIIKYGAVMLAVFSIIMSPWWLRNYREYGEFIPLAASSGNPMLQGTYVDYKQTPENIVYYKLGRNAYETNRIEVSVAKDRIKAELNRDFFGYIRWFILGKTFYLWNSAFYWKQFFGISRYFVLAHHYIILLGFLGIALLLFNKIHKYVLPISVILYFNAVHCVYMAFDRYAFPLLPLLSVFSAYFIYTVYSLCKSFCAAVIKGSG